LKKQMVKNARRIAVLLPSMEVGGAERLVLEELSILKDDSRFAFEVHLIFEKGPLFDELSALGLPVRVWRAPHNSAYMLGTYMGLIRHLRGSRCDIVHSHLLDWSGPMAGKLSGAKVVATVHSDRKFSALERFALSRSDLVLGCGQAVLRNVSGFVSQGKVRALSNALRTPAGAGIPREEVLGRFGFRKESRLVLSMGRLILPKGYDILIEAFRRVVPEVPEAVLLICGDGAEKDSLAGQVEAAGLSESVRLPGVVREAREVMAVCDLYVNSSRREGLPMTLLEASAYGRAMVATDTGGNPEVVRDGLTGALVPPDDPERLAAAIIRMLRDEGLRRRAGNAASALFLSEYTIKRHCEKLAGYYDGL